MLIEFSVENYKSIKEKATLNMAASADKKMPGNVCVFELPKVNNKFKKKRILKTAAIYGANASGKSNILKAVEIVQKIIISSNQYQQGQLFPIDNFRLDERSMAKPTCFEFIFVHNNIKYAYQLELTKQKVVEENLYHWPNGKQVLIFERTNNDINFNTDKKLSEKDELRNRIYAEDIAENILFLSLANKVNIKPLKESFDWFCTKLRVITKQTGLGMTTQMIDQNTVNKDDVLKYLKIADPLIANLDIIKNKIDDVDENHLMNDFFQKFVLPDIARKENIKIENIKSIEGFVVNEKTQRVGLDGFGNEKLFSFDLADDESDGTKRYYGIIGQIIDCLNKGCVLLFDEIELRLHTLLSKSILELFISDTNKNCSQLIISSHDVTLLDDCNLFRRDQVWFTEKQDNGATELYSIDDFTGIRNSLVKSKNYLKGKFGAIPQIDLEILND